MQNFRSILHLWVRVKSICSTEVLVLFYHLEKLYLITGYFKICEYHLTMNS